MAEVAEGGKADESGKARDKSSIIIGAIFQRAFLPMLTIKFFYPTERFSETDSALRLFESRALYHAGAKTSSF